MNTANQNNKEKGFILITVVLMIVILSLIGITGMVVSSNEVLIAGYINKSKEVFYVAEAAIEEVKYHILNDPMKGRATAVSAAPNTLTDDSQSWTTDELQGMQAVDVSGVEFNILNNTGTVLSLDGVNPPLEGIYYIAFSYRDRGTIVNGIGTADTFTATAIDWTGIDWSGCLFRDTDSVEFTINSNTINTLTVVGTPATGTGEIICNRGNIDAMNVTDIGFSIPTYINTNQTGWILIDSNNNKYNVDDLGGFAGNTIFLENGAGTPANGDFVVTRPAWMYDIRSSIVGNGVTSTWTKAYAIGPATAMATVTIERVGTTKGSYTITSVGSLARARKAISTSVGDSGNGDTMFTDWQEIVPP
jgi:hypothetical protein